MISNFAASFSGINVISTGKVVFLILIYSLNSRYNSSSEVLISLEIYYSLKIPENPSSVEIDDGFFEEMRWDKVLGKTQRQELYLIHQLDLSLRLHCS